MRVCSDNRATSKRLCFMASMARSNRTLSGCFESTFAIGLVTFLFVPQAKVKASTLKRRITGIRRDIKLLRTPGLCREGSLNASLQKKPKQLLNLLQLGFGRRLQKFCSIIRWIAFTEHSVACHQNFRPCLNHLGHSVETNTTIYFDPIIKVLLAPQLRQFANLVQRSWNKLLASESRIHRHHQYIIDDVQHLA